MAKCTLCPRECGADREHGELGFCGVGNILRIARVAPHMWEEPFISGKNGSGTIFFSGCNLQCVYCQNHVVSHLQYGEDVSDEKFERLVLNIAKTGVHNVNLVTPTHYSDKLIPLLKKIRPQISIPIVYNCSGYEKVETIKALEGLIDVYLPDFKYYADDIALRYSGIPDYRDVATKALREMYRQTGEKVIEPNGLLLRGLVVRHLVLPGHRYDSIAVLRHLASFLPIDGFYLSLMNQYTPAFAKDSKYDNLKRKTTSFEYNSVLKEAEAIGFSGCRQQRNSSDTFYVPDFKKDTITFE